MGTIKRTHIYPHPRLDVWQAISDSDSLTAWLMQNDFKPEIGHTFTFNTDPAPGFDGVVHSEVLELTPGYGWKISWNTGSLETTLEIQLRDCDQGTELKLVHAGFGLKSALPWVALAAGWKKQLVKNLTIHLEKGDKA